MNWLLARLREGSTWRGLVWLLTVAGVRLDPDQSEAIIVAGMAGAGLLGVFLQDRKRPVTERTRETDLPPMELQGSADPERNAADRADDGDHRLRVDVLPDRHDHPELDERGSAQDWHGWNG